jgi:hypothetical protein
MNIEIEGAKEASLGLGKKNVSILNAIEKAVTQAVFHMEAEVKESISGNRAEPKSVDTGRFRASVKATMLNKDKGKVESNVEYAGALEFGTTKRQGRHHFQNTMFREESKIKDMVMSEVQAVLK